MGISLFSQVESIRLQRWKSGTAVGAVAFGLGAVVGCWFTAVMFDWSANRTGDAATASVGRSEATEWSLSGGGGARSDAISDDGSLIGRIRALAEFLETASRDDLVWAWRECQARLRSGAKPGIEEELLFHRLGVVLGEEVFEGFDGLPAYQKTGSLYQAALRGWASRDPSGAMRWHESLGDAQAARGLAGALVEGAAEDSNESAERVFRSFAVDVQLRAMSTLVAEKMDRAGVDGVFGWIASEFGDPAASADPGMEETLGRSAGLAAAVAGSAADVAKAREAVGDLVNAGLASADVVRPVVETLAARDPVSAADWLASLDAPRHEITVGFEEFIGKWARSDPEGAGRWLAEHADVKGRDRLVWRFAEEMDQVDPEVAANWRSTVADPQEMERIAERRRRTPGVR